MASEAAPDAAEEEHAEQVDDMVPTYGYGMVPVVGLGGSAGSIEALHAFFEKMPANTGMAFVVVIHLSSAHESTLAEVLQRSTAMPVVQVRDALDIRAGCVYVIPPGKLLRCSAGRLSLIEPVPQRAPHVAVDIFFRTLADSHGPHAAAVVLSGMDGDGAIGIKRVKERGGLTVAQDPTEATYEGMPTSSIATGMVDWILPVRAMPARLLTYFRLEQRLHLPGEGEPAPQGEAAAEERAFADVLGFVSARTGRSFENYKRATVLRRIARRMQVNGVDNLQAYLACLGTRPGECAALLQDLLISVTNFFRDSTAFAALEAQLPALFDGRKPGDPVRVWVAACATGEEAYSIAMLLAEHARTLPVPPTIQVFASDIDEEGLRAARHGNYPLTIEADVSADRLERYFQREAQGYRVRRELREMVLFAVHDILKDPAFSRLDLVTCRNLLIYLNQEAQKRVLATLHFALVPGGMLFLGTSDSAEDAHELFKAVDKKNRIYMQRPLERGRGLPPALASPGPGGARMLPAGGPFASGAAFDKVAGQEAPANLAGAVRRRALELHVQVLEQLGPPSILVDTEYDLVHLSPTAGRFLRVAGGEPTRNLLRLLDPDLSIVIRAALFQAGQVEAVVPVPPVMLSVEGVPTAVGARVSHSVINGNHLFLVQFIADTAAGPAPDGQAPDGHAIARHLDREIERLKAHLRETVEQYEVAAEESKASNEELRAMNEELRSATEEMETSREEAQSMNEELNTVNVELQKRIGELGDTNNDLQNLVAATEIATVFVDTGLRITRYTPAATTLFHLIPTDVGRPLTDLTTLLHYPELAADAARVLDKLVPIEREVGRSGGAWYLARLLPYRTVDNRIAGVVFAFIDIAARKQAEEMGLWLSAVVGSTSDGIISFDMRQTILSWNFGAERLFGHSAQEAIGRPLALLTEPHGAQPHEWLARIEAGLVVENHVVQARRKDGSDFKLSLTLSPMRDEAGKVIAATAVARDVTAAQSFALELRSNDELYRLISQHARGFAVFTTDLERRITRWSAAAQRLLGLPEAQALGRSADIFCTPEDRGANVAEKEAHAALVSGHASATRLHQRSDGHGFRAIGSTSLLRNAAGEPAGFVRIIQDLSEATGAAETL